jgi:hypothetical protein
MLDTLSTLYFDTMVRATTGSITERATAVLQVEGLINRLKETGQVSSVVSTLERIV